MIPPHLLAEAKAAWKTETFDTSNDKECFLAGAEFMFSRLLEMSWEFSANEFQEMADAIPLETWLTIPKTSARKLVDHYRAIDQAALLEWKEREKTWTEMMDCQEAALLKARSESEANYKAAESWKEQALEKFDIIADLDAERARCELFKNALTEISKLKNSDFAGQYSIMAAKIARQALSGKAK